MPILFNRGRPRESEVFLRGENIGWVVVHAIAQARGCCRDSRAASQNDL
jgi:hypothetical protein